MPLPTQPVTCRFFDQSGNPAAGARVVFRLSVTEVYDGFVAPELVEATADVNGECVVSLFPNALGSNASQYEVKAWNADDGRKILDAYCTVPDSACLLHEIVILEPYPAVDQALQAMLAAQSAISLVTEQRLLAETAAGDAADSASAASTSAGAASTSAAEAAASAAAAETSGSAIALRADLATPATGKGAEMVANQNGGTVQDFIDTVETYISGFVSAGDGIAVDLPRILAAFAAHKTVEFEEGVYNLGNAVDGQTLIDLSGRGTGVSIITRGRVEFLVNMTEVGLANVFRLINNSDFYCGVIHLRDTGYSNLASPIRGVRGFMIEGGSAGGWQGINIEAVHAKNIVAPVYVTGGDASNRVRGINIGQLIADDCYYGYTSANNGDGVRIGQIIGRRNYRPYFAYGCTDHDVKVLGIDNRNTSGAINISRSPGGLNTSAIRVKYTARQQTNDINHVLINHIDLLGGDIKDIHVEYDIESSVIYTPVKFVNYTGSGGAETDAASSNTVSDIRLTGTCDARARAITAFASYASSGSLEVNAGQFVTMGAELFSKFNLFAQVKDSFYAPSWTSTGTNPAIGNGSFFGRYSLSDGLCHATINLTGGSTTTWGTGQYSFSLPFTAKANAVGSFQILDNGSAFYAGAVLVNAGTNTAVLYVNGAGGGVGAATPMTWANGDQMRATVIFPVA